MHFSIVILWGFFFRYLTHCLSPTLSHKLEFSQSTATSWWHGALSYGLFYTLVVSWQNSDLWIHAIRGTICARLQSILQQRAFAVVGSSVCLSMEVLVLAAV